MELLGKIVRNRNPLAIFSKSFILGVGQGSELASAKTVFWKWRRVKDIFDSCLPHVGSNIGIQNVACWLRTGEQPWCKGNEDNFRMNLSLTLQK